MFSSVNKNVNLSRQFEKVSDPRPDQRKNDLASQCAIPGIKKLPNDFFVRAPTFHQVRNHRRSTYGTQTRRATLFSTVVRHSTYTANVIPYVIK